MIDIGKPSPLVVRLSTDLAEAGAEMERHHRDFAAISDICQQWAERDIDPVTALRRIRNIVG